MNIVLFCLLLWGFAIRLAVHVACLFVIVVSAVRTMVDRGCSRGGTGGNKYLFNQQIGWIIKVSLSLYDNRVF